MRNQWQNGVYRFGPSLRRPSTKKKPRSRIMQKSRREWKKTRECFRLLVPNRNNNANERGNDDGAKIARVHNGNTYDSSKMVYVNDHQDKAVAQKMRQIPSKEPSNARVAPQPNDLKRPSSLMRDNGVVSPQKNIEKSRPSSSRLNSGVVSPRRNVETSRSSSSRPGNDVVPPQRNAETSRPSSLRPGNDMAPTQRNAETCRSSSLRSDGVVSPQRNVETSEPFSSRSSNGMVSPQRNTQKSSPSSLRLNNGLVTPQKIFEKSRPSSLRLNNGIVSPQKNIKQSRPSRFRDGFFPRKLEKIDSVGSKDDSNSTLGVLKKYHPLPAIHNSSNIEPIVSGEVHKQDRWMAEEALNSILDLKGNQIIQDLWWKLGNNSSPKFGKNLLSQETADASCMGNNVERNGESLDGCVQLDSRNHNTSLAEDGRTNDDKFKSKRKEPLLEETIMKEPLPEEKSETHEDDDSEEADNCRPTKRRRYIASEYEDEDDDDGDHNLAGVEGGTAGLTTRTALVKDRCTEVFKPFVSYSVKLQHYSSLPIDEPIWSGILKIGSKEYVSLAAHLSTKYCENVWKLSRSLRPMVEVTKLSRLDAWPKSFEASRPTDDNIALYFLPHEMRPDEDLDHLVMDVMENDMVLRAVVGEAEMLIFASNLLPEQHQTFQRKPYLWGVFKRREDDVATVEEEQQGIGRCAHEEKMGKQHASHCGVGKDGYRVAGLNMDVGLEAPKEAERQGMEQELTPLLARPNAPHLAEGSARPTSAPEVAAMPANHGQIHSSLGVPSGAVFGFVVRQTPRLEKLIQEMEHEGAVVVAMRGEMIALGLSQPMATG